MRLVMGGLTHRRLCCDSEASDWCVTLCDAADKVVSSQGRAVGLEGPTRT